MKNNYARPRKTTGKIITKEIIEARRKAREDKMKTVKIDDLLNNLTWIDSDEANDRYYLNFGNDVTAIVKMSDHPEAKEDEDYFEDEETQIQAILEADNDMNLYYKDGIEVRLEK